MVHGENRIPYWIDRRLTGLAGPDYGATISLGLSFEPEDCQYGKCRLQPVGRRIVKLLRALAQVEGISVGKWAKAREYGRYLASSIKGEAAIDWSDKRARTALLAGIVADADQLLELSRQTQGELAENGEERQRFRFRN